MASNREPPIEISLLAMKCLLNEKERHRQAASKGLKEWNRAKHAVLTISKPPVGTGPIPRDKVRRMKA